MEWGVAIATGLLASQNSACLVFISGLVLPRLHEFHVFLRFERGDCSETRPALATNECWNARRETPVDQSWFELRLLMANECSSFPLDEIRIWCSMVTKILRWQSRQIYVAPTTSFAPCNHPKLGLFSFICGFVSGWFAPSTEALPNQNDCLHRLFCISGSVKI